jgi:hypothetical protein
MNDQYPKHVIDSQHARRHLAQGFTSGLDLDTKRRFLPVSNRSLVTTPQENGCKRETSYRDPVSSTTSFVHRTRSRNSMKLPCNEKRDMSGFSFVLILMLLCEIAASQTDNPVFWLLIGPTPLALALASSRLLRYRSIPQKSPAGRNHQAIAG